MAVWNLVRHQADGSCRTQRCAFLSAKAAYSGLICSHPLGHSCSHAPILNTWLVLAEAAGCKSVALHSPVSEGIRAAERGRGSRPRCSLLRSVDCQCEVVSLCNDTFSHRHYYTATRLCTTYTQRCEHSRTACIDQQHRQQRQKRHGSAADCSKGSGRSGRPRQ